LQQRKLLTAQGLPTNFRPFDFAPLDFACLRQAGSGSPLRSDRADFAKIAVKLHHCCAAYPVGNKGVKIFFRKIRKNRKNRRQGTGRSGKDEVEALVCALERRE